MNDGQSTSGQSDSDSRQCGVSGDGQSSRTPGYGRLCVVAAVIIAAIAAGYLTPLRGYLARVGEIGAWLGQFGWAAPVVFTVGMALLVAIGVPRLLLCGVGGLAFGFWEGLILAQIATVAGSYVTFLFVRWGGRDWVLEHWPQIRRYSGHVSDNGLLSILIARQVPVSGFLVNSLLGLTHVNHRDFLVGTAIGVWPEAIPATLIGAGAAQFSPAKTLSYLLVAAVWLVIIGVALRRFRRAYGLGGCATGQRTETGITEAEDAVEEGK